MARKKPKLPKLRPILQRVGAVALRVVEDGTSDFAHEHRDRFVERIQDQDFDSFQVVFYPDSGTNLSPRWLMRKALKGADSRTMIATGHYIAQIKVFRKELPRGARYRVGFHPSARARDLDGHTQDITLDRVARVLEHGSQKMRIPARPHWQPHFDLMHEEAPDVRVTLARRVKRQVNKRLPGLIGGA